MNKRRYTDLGKNVEPTHFYFSNSVLYIYQHARSKKIKENVITIKVRTLFVGDTTVRSGVPQTARPQTLNSTASFYFHILFFLFLEESTFSCLYFSRKPISVQFRIRKINKTIFYVFIFNPRFLFLKNKVNFTGYSYSLLRFILNSFNCIYCPAYSIKLNKKYTLRSGSNQCPFFVGDSIV